MYCIIALGNPTEKLAKTRHNAGWLLLDYMFPNLQYEHTKPAKAHQVKVDFAGTQVELLKPQTFMNESGISASYVKKKYGIENNQFIVLHDEVDVPLGEVKISYMRGDAGHNGIKSITAHLGGSDYYRVRIGLAQRYTEGKFIKPNVLGNFTESELEILKKMAPKVKEGLEILMTKGYEKAATFLNGANNA